MTSPASQPGSTTPLLPRAEIRAPSGASSTSPGRSPTVRRGEGPLDGPVELWIDRLTRMGRRSADRRLHRLAARPGNDDDRAAGGRGHPGCPRSHQRTGLTMGRLIYSLNVSLDGFVETPDHSLAWANVDDELHTWFNDQARELAASLYGRRMYELMSSYWPTRRDRSRRHRADARFRSDLGGDAKDRLLVVARLGRLQQPAGARRCRRGACARCGRSSTATWTSAVPPWPHRSSGEAWSTSTGCSSIPWCWAPERGSFRRSRARSRCAGPRRDGSAPESCTSGTRPPSRHPLDDVVRFGFGAGLWFAMPYTSEP